MADFAKLFNDPKIGQILVMLERSDDDKPELSFRFCPPNLGVCSCSITFKDSDDGWDGAEKVLAEMSVEKAAKFVMGSLEQTGADCLLDK